MEQRICLELFEPRTFAPLFSVPVYTKNIGILSLWLLGIQMVLLQVEIMKLCKVFPNKVDPVITSAYLLL